MKALLVNFRKALANPVLDFLWEQWGRMGVQAGIVRGGSPIVIDPETLILLTLECAREDPRMLDEVLDWMIVNGRWVNVVRLSSLLGKDGVGSTAVVGAFASFLSQYDKTPKWSQLAKTCLPDKEHAPEPLFRKFSVTEKTPAYQKDPVFSAYGLQRQPVHLRHQSAPVDMSEFSNLYIKLRALFGVSIRADIMTFLLVYGEGHPSKMARELGYSQRRVQDTLVALTEADVGVKVRTETNKSVYFLDPKRGWETLLGMSSEVGKPFVWRPFARGITTVWRCAFGLKEKGMTPYILESEVSKAIGAAQSELWAAGLSWNPKKAFEVEGDTVKGSFMDSLECLSR